MWSVGVWGLEVTCGQGLFLLLPGGLIFPATSNVCVFTDHAWICAIKPMLFGIKQMYIVMDELIVSLKK